MFKKDKSYLTGKALMEDFRIVVQGNLDTMELDEITYSIVAPKLTNVSIK
jgi:hypothetical protein